MTEVIERAARAAFNTKWGEEYTYSEEDRAFYEPLARTVLESLLPPDEEIVEATASALFGRRMPGVSWDGQSERSKDTWRRSARAAIDTFILCALGRKE